MISTDNDADLLRARPSPAPATPPASAVDPFDQGLPRPVVLRLLAGKFSSADYALYRRTDHWAAARRRAMSMHGYACQMCDSPIAVQAHHRTSGYRALFREDPEVHLTVLCRKCHKRHHSR